MSEEMRTIVCTVLLLITFGIVCVALKEGFKDWYRHRALLKRMGTQTGDPIDITQLKSVDEAIEALEIEIIKYNKQKVKFDDSSLLMESRATDISTEDDGFSIEKWVEINRLEKTYFEYFLSIRKLVNEKSKEYNAYILDSMHGGISHGVADGTYINNLKQLEVLGSDKLLKFVNLKVSNMLQNIVTRFIVSESRILVKSGKNTNIAYCWATLNRTLHENRKFNSSCEKIAEQLIEVCEEYLSCKTLEGKNKLMNKRWSARLW